MRSPSLSKSKSEVFGQSGHCSARLLAALRANCWLMHRGKILSIDHLVGERNQIVGDFHAERLSGLDGGGRHNEESGGASGGAEIRICGSTISKPKWARHNGKWGPVKPDFWRIWHANKESLKKNGYEVRRNDNGQYEVRYIPPPKWPPVGASPILVPEGMKASICFKCGHVRLIKMIDEHKACGLCGATLD